MILKNRLQNIVILLPNRATFIIALLLILISLGSIAQTAKIDSLKKILAIEKIDTNKVLLQWQLVQEYESNSIDTAYLYAQRAYSLAKSISYTDGESKTLVSLANYFVDVGNYPLALEYYLRRLKIEEKSGVMEKLASTYINISIVYYLQEQYNEALLYIKLADSIIRLHNIEKWELNSLLTYGSIYYNLKMQDSALYYTTKVLNKAIQKNDKRFIGNAYNNLGNIYFAKSDTSLALQNYYHAIPLLKETKDDDFFCETLLGIAKVFASIKKYDSAEYYGRYSLHLAKYDEFKSRELDAYAFFVDYFSKKKLMDSAFIYQNKMFDLKEIISGKEKVRKSQVLTIDEQRRQEEIAEAKRKEKEELNQRLQLILIGISIPIIFLITLVLSRQKINIKMIRFLGIISLLFLFEYLTLLLHPVVKEITHHTPVLELLIFVAIASVLIPAHHRIQHWVIEKLTHRDLTVVKETINSIEGFEADTLEEEPNKTTQSDSFSIEDNNNAV